MTGGEPAGRRAPDIAATLEEARALQTERATRDRRGLFFVEGVRNVVQVVDHGFTVERILVSDRLLTAPIARKLVRQCRRAGVPTLDLTPEQFRRLSRAERASGVAAVLRQRWASLDDVSPHHGLCWIALETVRSPGNLGTLIRSSQAAGGAGFVFVGNSADPFSPEVVRSAMGALYRQTFVRADWEALRRWTTEWQCAVIGATPDGATDLHRLRCPRAPLLVLGEERRGLSARQRALCGSFVRIPMDTGTDSLNLGVAGSLLLYEVYRTHGAATGAGPVP